MSETLQDVEDFGDQDDFETFYQHLEESAKRIRMALALVAMECSEGGRFEQYPRSPKYDRNPDGFRSPVNFTHRDGGDSRGHWEPDRDRRDGYRGGYDRADRAGDKCADSRGERHDDSRGDRRDDSRGRYDRGGYPASSGYLKSPTYPRSPGPSNPNARAVGGLTPRVGEDRPPTPRSTCVYCKADDHVKRDCPDLKRAIDEGVVVFDDRKYVKWADDLGDVSMFPSMKENVDARRVRPSKGKEVARSWSIRILMSSDEDEPTMPIRVAATKSARSSSSKKTDIDYVMAEKDGQRIDGEEVLLSPRKRGARKFTMKSSLDDIDTLDEANLTVSGTKSRWAVSSIKILGFICDSRGQRADPTKLDKLLNWPTPLHSAMKVRQFLGVVGYWQIFIRAYAEKAELLRILLRKTEKFYWDFSQELAILTLKGEFKDGGRILGVPFFDDETNRPFIVSTDVGRCSVGGLLSQKDADGKARPLRFEKRTLNTAERNYSQFKKEVLAVLRCLDTFRHYIYGRRFILRVDPTAVASVLQKDFTLTDPTIARWLIRIRLYDYTVERISGAKNVVADGLSRIPIEVERSITVTALTITEPRRTDQFLVNLYEGKYRAIELHPSGEESPESETRRQAT
ncbi:hypothetical protein CBR_g48924 [Chara braunii]|uniref:Reverse transcriptase RNase H-like domain-containing protein n=1 Tax=Chara braunii TaxID=69332 RepID=A0A388M3U8_CHABU|nr:hypothetical protein CBR_g48924 [Chara braunii]|eukprot:GBG89216.1 hypothetical protein CBR_g48924 [Chara braunii]